MVITPFAAPNRIANSTAWSGVMPTSTRSAKANTIVPIEMRATHTACSRPPEMKSANLVTTCEGPNSAPMVTASPASMPPRCRMVSRCVVVPDSTKA